MYLIPKSFLEYGQTDMYIKCREALESQETLDNLDNRNAAFLLHQDACSPAAAAKRDASVEYMDFVILCLFSIRE